jgi:hypothetical protein
MGHLLRCSCCVWRLLLVAEPTLKKNNEKQAIRTVSRQTILLSIYVFQDLLLLLLLAFGHGQVAVLTDAAAPPGMADLLLLLL